MSSHQTHIAQAHPPQHTSHAVHGQHSTSAPEHQNQEGERLHLHGGKQPSQPQNKLTWLIVSVTIVSILLFARHQYWSNQHALLNANQKLSFIHLKGGSFMMGNEDNPLEGPVHLVTVNDFEISMTEVTVAQYHQCVEAGACDTNHLNLSTFGESNHCNWDKKNRHLHPINCISWQQARSFAQWAGGDLPTEAQWEYAMRSQGQPENYPWGNQTPSCEYANLGDQGDACGSRMSKEICSFPKGNSKQGLCDMMGNVWEWVLDEFHQQYDNAPVDGSAWCQAQNCEGKTIRTIRGGAWDIDQKHLQDGKRDSMKPEDRKHTLGFRLVKKH